MQSFAVTPPQPEWKRSKMSSVKSKNPSAGSAETELVRVGDRSASPRRNARRGLGCRRSCFSVHGTKGWDDVGVRFRNGTTRLFQMKHSRSDDTLTFGDLMAAGEDNAPSLLRALARAWKNEHSVRGKVECVLVTNRTAGPNWYKGRPPLAEFFTKIKARADSVATIGDVRWDGKDERYSGAWELFLTELSDLEPAEQLAFLKALELETSAPDLVALEVLLKERLAALTGLPLPSRLWPTARGSAVVRHLSAIAPRSHLERSELCVTGRRGPCRPRSSSPRKAVVLSSR